MPEMSKELKSALITTFNYIATRKAEPELWVTNKERDNLIAESSRLATELIKESAEGDK